MLYSIVPSMVLCLLCCYSYSFSHTHFIHSIRIPSVYSFHVFMSIPSGILRTSIHATLQSCMYAQRKKRVPLGTLKERKSQSHQHHHNPSQHKQHHSSTSPYQGQHSSKSIPFSAQIYTILSIQTCIPLGIHTTITTLNDLLYNVNSVLKCTTLHRKTCYTM